MLVNRIGPVNLFWLFDGVDIGDIDHDGLIVRAHEYAFEGFVWACIDLLMRNKRRNVDKIPRSCFGHIFKMVSPAHARPAAHNIDHAFELAVMVNARLGVGLDRHRPGPYLLRSDPGVIDCRLPEHARCLGGIGIKSVAFDDSNAVVLPALQSWCVCE